MCGRFMLDSNMDTILGEYRIVRNEVEDYRRGDIYPSENTPILVHEDVRALKSAKWGFPLSGKSQLVINARSESISSKYMFKDAFKDGRCIIPANSFYEWKAEGDKKKVKHEIYLKDKKIISFGGIFKFTLNNQGQSLLSFVIITTEANDQMKDIHNRMPLIIEDSELDTWLDSTCSISTVEDILKSNGRHKLGIDRENEDKDFGQMKLF